MRKSKKAAIGSIIIGLTILFCSNVFADNIFTTIFPPKDLYTPLINQEINPVNEKEFEFAFQNKYSGIHSIGYYCGLGKKQYYQDNLAPVKISVKFYIDNKMFFEPKEYKQYSPFIGKNGDGFHIARFKCPNDLPAKKCIKCVVQITEINMELYEKSKPIRFFIGKSSDK